MGEPQASRLWFTHFSYDKTAQALPERRLRRQTGIV